jgi:hypothetical protein
LGFEYLLLKMKDMKVKWVLFRGWVQWEEGGIRKR